MSNQPHLLALTFWFRSKHHIGLNNPPGKQGVKLVPHLLTFDKEERMGRESLLKIQEALCGPNLRHIFANLTSLFLNSFSGLFQYL